MGLDVLFHHPDGIECEREFAVNEWSYKTCTYMVAPHKTIDSVLRMLFKHFHVYEEEVKTIPDLHNKDRILLTDGAFIYRTPDFLEFCHNWNVTPTFNQRDFYKFRGGGYASLIMSLTGLDLHKDLTKEEVKLIAYALKNVPYCSQFANGVYELSPEQETYLARKRSYFGLLGSGETITVAGKGKFTAMPIAKENYEQLTEMFQFFSTYKGGCSTYADY